MKGKLDIVEVRRQEDIMSNNASNIAIKVENLSKKYIIRHEKKSGNYETFSETLIQSSKNIASKIALAVRMLTLNIF